MIPFLSGLFQPWTGTPRSPRWPTVRKNFMRGQSYCRACGVTQSLEVHHIVPVHIAPERELDVSNLIVLCRDCHWFLGHLQHWDSPGNPHILIDAAHYRARYYEVIHGKEAKDNETQSG